MNGVHTTGNRRSCGRSTRRAPFRYASRRSALEARGGWWRDAVGRAGRRGGAGGGGFPEGRSDPRSDWPVSLPSDSVTRVFPRLDLMWSRPPKTLAFFPAEHWSLDATGTVTVPPGGGVYSVRTISDDAIRVWIDDSLAIDDWTPHESQVDYAALSAGTHRLRVAYQQVDGWVELRVEVVRGAARSSGSPGPH